jgi:anti-sigma28 factor (negative regulator of flagellin synthesis)
VTVNLLPQYKRARLEVLRQQIRLGIYQVDPRLVVDAIVKRATRGTQKSRN